MIWLCILAALMAILLAAAYYGYRQAFYHSGAPVPPPDYIFNDQVKAVLPTINAMSEDFQSAPYETVSIRSQDGLTLKGRYYHVADNAPVYIQMHGYKGNGIHDFCGTWGIARDLGHNVLLADQRCHGDSDGHTITFGIRERQDCLAWVQYATERFGNVPMLLMGVSMGAATVLMASALELPQHVKAIVADCPYDTPAGIIKKALGVEMGLPVKPVYPFIRLGGMLYGGFDLESGSPLASIKNAKVPILLIHGEEDRFVPCEMSQNLHNAAPDITTLRTIPKSGHALNQVTDPALYRSILVPFIREHLAG